MKDVKEYFITKINLEITVNYSWLRPEFSFNRFHICESANTRKRLFKIWFIILIHQ